MAVNVLKGIAKNSSILFVQQALTTFFSFVLMLFLPRYLGPAEFGRVHLAIAITAIFGVLVNYGSSYLVAKDVARTPALAPQFLIDTLAIRLVLAIVSVAGIMVFANLMEYSRETLNILWAFSLVLVLSAGTASLSACYQGLEVLKYSSYGIIAERVLITTVGIVALLSGGKGLAYGIVAFFGVLLNLLVLTAFAKNSFSSIPKVNWRAAFGQLRIGFPYFLFTVFSTIYYRIDSIMLSKMSSVEVVGKYGAAYRLFESLNFPYLLTIALYPVLARLWKEETAVHGRATQKSLEYIILLGLPFSFGAVWFARDAISLFYGLSGYGQSIVLFQILAAGLPLLYVDMIIGTTLMASDRQNQLVVVSLAAIPLNIILNLFMIPYFESVSANGAIGAALATGITELAIFISGLQLLPKGTLEGLSKGAVIKAVVSTALMISLLMLLQQFGIFWVFQIFIGATAYITFVILLKAIEETELDLIKRGLSIGYMKIHNLLLASNKSKMGRQ